MTVVLNSYILKNSVSYELFNLKIYLKSNSFDCSGSNDDRQIFSRVLQDKEISLKNLNSGFKK